MNLYHLGISLDKKISGSVHPHVVSDQNCYFDYEEYSKAMGGRIRDDFQFPTFHLAKRAKMMDIFASAVANTPMNPIVSYSFLEVLLKLNTPEFQIFDTSIRDKQGGIHPYKILSQYNRVNEAIDYSKTVFEHALHRYGKGVEYSVTKHDFQVNNFEEIQKYRALHGGNVCAKSLYFDKEKIQYDIFLTNIPLMWVATEKAKEAFEESKIIGPVFVPLIQGEEFCVEGVVDKKIKFEHG